MHGNEIWKPVAQQDGLEISNHGRVRSSRRGKTKILKLGHIKAGYVGIVVGNRVTGRKTRMVAHLVAEAFIGPRPPGLYVLHLNGDSLDNRVENLKYGTQKENMEHKKIHRTHVEGSRVPHSKLSEVQVAEIRRRYVSRCKQNGTKALSMEFGVHRNTILDAVSGRQWAHVK